MKCLSMKFLKTVFFLLIVGQVMVFSDTPVFADELEASEVTYTATRTDAEYTNNVEEYNKEENTEYTNGIEELNIEENTEYTNDVEEIKKDEKPETINDVEELNKEENPEYSNDVEGLNKEENPEYANDGEILIGADHPDGAKIDNDVKIDADRKDVNVPVSSGYTLPTEDTAKNTYFSKNVRLSVKVEKVGKKNSSPQKKDKGAAQDNKQDVNAKLADEDVQIAASLAIDIPAVPNVTMLDGIDYSKVYDYSFYLNNNPDVLEVFNGDPVLTLTHFIRYGMNERRRAAESFDVNSYSNSYADLRAAYLNDASKYYYHYMNCGFREGRKTTGEAELQGTVTALNGIDYSNVYDYQYYIRRYPDIKKFVSTKLAPDAAALEHFIRYGMNERRIAIKEFDVTSYSNCYQDLRLAYGQDAPSYYMHYIKYGKREGRRAVGTEKLINPVSSVNGRDYSRVYNYEYYIGKHSDIKNFVSAKLAPDAAALEHFLRYGMREKRQASKGFDVVSYYRTYQDLRVAYHNNYPAYYEHYINYGYNEKRKAVGEKTLQDPVTKYAGVDFGKIYDYKFYTTKNKDILNAYGEDDIETLHHFVKWGMNEGRQAKASYDINEYNRLKKDAGYIVMDERAAALKYTIDRLLKNALLPIGQTMYIWGGGWNEEDTGAGVEAVTIGVSPRWKEYADAQSSSYDYNDTRYQIHDGLDCTGYIGWMVYNTFNDENGHEGYVSEEPEDIFLAKGWGKTVSTNEPKPGDICSTPTHVWMSLGCCNDGSILIAHASPPGCSICGTLLPDGSKSEAVMLAEKIMKTYYPNWYSRYPDCSRKYSYITNASVFSWNTDTLADPNNLKNKSAYEIADYLFR